MTLSLLPTASASVSLIASAAPRGMGLSPVPSAAAWPCAAVLIALAARSAARLLADRASVDPELPGCGRTSSSGDAVHLAMAAGMVAMVVPLGVPAVVLAVFFTATTAVGAFHWLLRIYRRRTALRRGAAPACRPAHAMEPHHLIVGLAMVAMAARMRGSGEQAVAHMNTAHMNTAQMNMAQMNMTGVSMSSVWLDLSTLSLIYIWTAVLVLGAGLARAVSGQPAPSGGAAVLSASVTVYACELTMTVVMGLMLLG